MALPGDARLVFDVPPARDTSRRATVTMGFLQEDGELAPDARTFLLTAHEEASLALWVRQKVTAECGPSFS